jgi:hypothetical protein
MTKEELDSKHFQYPNDKASDAEKHSKLSIEYAISVLEDTRRILDGHALLIGGSLVHAKIEELKKLL